MSAAKSSRLPYPILVLVLSVIAIAMLVAAAFAPGFGNRNALIAHMNGDKAVPKGDPDAKGRAEITLRPRKDKVCFEISFTGLSPDNPFAGHIHKGARGVAGPIKITLYEGAARPSPWTGCTQDGVTDALLTKIRRHPERFYVNLHNTQYSSGAIRGQLRQ